VAPIPGCRPRETKVTPNLLLALVIRISVASARHNLLYVLQPHFYRVSGIPSTNSRTINGSNDRYGYLPNVQEPLVKSPHLLTVELCCTPCPIHQKLVYAKFEEGQLGVNITSRSPPAENAFPSPVIDHEGHLACRNITSYQ
jgi:hypothetical protein